MVMQQIEINDQIIEDTLVSALEGGSNYWACIVGYKNKKPAQNQEDAMSYAPSYITTPLSDNGVLLLKDEEENVTLELNRKKLKDGIKVMAEKYPRHFGDMLSGNGDATTGDVLLQCALFGEVQYG